MCRCKSGYLLGPFSTAPLLNDAGYCRRFRTGQDCQMNDRYWPKAAIHERQETTQSRGMFE